MPGESVRTGDTVGSYFCPRLGSQLQRLLYKLAAIFLKCIPTIAIRIA